MNDFYIVKADFLVQTLCQEKVLVNVSSNESIENKVKLYFKSFEISKINITSIKKSVVSCFLGNTNADKLYLCKLRFIGSNITHPKKRVIAIGANSMNKAIELVDKAFEDISQIKKKILSDRQLKTIEYNNEIEYIDYEIDEIVRTDLSYIQ